MIKPIPRAIKRNRRIFLSFPRVFLSFPRVSDGFSVSAPPRRGAGSGWAGARISAAAEDPTRAGPSGRAAVARKAPSGRRSIRGFDPTPSDDRRSRAAPAPPQLRSSRCSRTKGAATPAARSTSTQGTQAPPNRIPPRFRKASNSE